MLRILKNLKVKAPLTNDWLHGYKMKRYRNGSLRHIFKYFML